MTSVKSITATEFKAKCLDILDHVPPEGLSITKRGKRVATLLPESSDIRHLYGSMPILNAEDDLFSTGLRWDAEF